MADLQVYVGYQLPVQAAFVDQEGNPAAIIGVPAWSTSNAAVVNVSVLPDGTCLLLGISTGTGVTITAVGTGYGGAVTLTVLVDCVSIYAVSGSIVVGEQVSQASQNPI